MSACGQMSVRNLIPEPCFVDRKTLL